MPLIYLYKSDENIYPKDLSWHWNNGSESVFTIEHYTNIWNYYITMINKMILVFPRNHSPCPSRSTNVFDLDTMDLVDRLQSSLKLYINNVVVYSLSRVWLWDPMDCNPRGSSVHGILQARILEWVAILFTKGSS